MRSRGQLLCHCRYLLQLGDCSFFPQNDEGMSRPTYAFASLRKKKEKKRYSLYLRIRGDLEVVIRRLKNK